ncbi:aldo/keto reductase [Saccharopolyspora rectivirgula]|jgi:2,5-diketo-D-gluconate reductase A|uniref:Oxidoreductase n=1 Tax=Saccharopolyspora rectivirgula TaxID=28042 RepID=A0A073B691_9PSEU|nr:aldo/keto reductase [Saccharopolyspora rectivirgula]KEI43129.1 oxidoreductase [Saccharopolyspora rectivirgula]
MSVPTVQLNNGVVIPQLGFGTYKVGYEAISTALATGYRLLDTAEMYGNEREVGRAIADSGIPRDELFVTTKVWNDHHGYQPALDAFHASKERLGLETIDLYLIHWPQPQLGLHAETWRALEELYADGEVRAIGVSNFTPAQLDELLQHADTPPAVNQIELNPGKPRTEERAHHREKNIATQAWAPLARGGVLQERAIQEIADAHGRTPAQVVLAWHLQRGIITIPRSSNPERIAENFAATQLTLSADELDRIGA